MSANQIPELTMGIIKEGRIVFVKDLGKVEKGVHNVVLNSLFLNNRIGRISENVLELLENGALLETANAKLNPGYWIFIALSVMPVIVFVISLIREIRYALINVLIPTSRPIIR